MKAINVIISTLYWVAMLSPIIMFWVYSETQNGVWFLASVAASGQLIVLNTIQKPGKRD